MFKRWFDLLFAIPALVVASPLMLAVAVIIRVSSGSPVLYRGWRAGRYGHPFQVLKFRTMVPNADKIGGAETPDNDPRITRVGSFLRRYKIDELPQLLNVIRGDMSIVGPRPEVLEEVENYTDSELHLLELRPGITDWASIKFHHEGRITCEGNDPHRAYHERIRPEKIRLGLEYVRRHTLLIDFRIIARTIYAVFE